MRSANGFAQIATARALRQAMIKVTGMEGGDGLGAGDSLGLIFPIPVYLQILDGLLLLLPKVLTLLLPVAAAQQQPAHAASSSSTRVSGKAAKSKGGSSGNSGQTAQEQSAQFDKALRSCVQGLLELYAALSAKHMTEYAGMQAPQQQHSPTLRGSLVCCAQAPPLREDAAVWFRHAVQTCRVLELYVRQMACSQVEGANCVLVAAAPELGSAAMQLIDPTEPGLRGPLLQAAAAAGPGSKEQQPLHGLLRSMLKWAGMMGPQQQGLAEQLRAAVAVAAANMLLAAGRSQVLSGSAALLTAEGKPVSEGGSASSSAGGGGSSHPQGSRAEQPAQHSITDSTAQQPAQHGSAHQSTAAAVLPHLPWLGVLGCCCLQWSKQLASLQSSSAAAAVSAARAAAGSADAAVPAAAAAAAASAPAALPHTGVPTRASGVLQVLSQDNIHSWGVAVAPIWQGQSLVMICVETARSWLGGLNSRLQGVGEEGIQPTGAGYAEPVRSATAAAEGFVTAWQALQDSVQQHPDAPIPLAGYVQQLSALGEALCSVAHKQSCNNPSCGNVFGPSELQLVKGRSNTCSGCCTARYCSPECMRQHWKQHRPVCKALARTAGDPAAASVAKGVQAAV